MSNRMSQLMFNWLEKRRRLWEAEDGQADAAEVLELEREATVAFAAWRDAVRALDRAA